MTINANPYRIVTVNTSSWNPNATLRKHPNTFDTQEAARQYIKYRTSEFAVMMHSEVHILRDADIPELIQEYEGKRIAGKVKVLE